MKRPFRIFTLLLLLVTTLALAACVRPIPGRETPTPTSEAAALPPTLPPQTAPTIPAPTPGLAASPTPGVEQPVEPPTAEPPPAVATSPSGETIYTVQPGDTLGKISQKFGVSVQEIAAANNITNVNVLEVGQQLIIPVPGSGVPPEATAVPPPQQPVEPPPGQGGGTHVVQRGENLFRIGLRYGCTVNQMAAANGIVNPWYIYPGQVLVIPQCN